LSYNVFEATAVFLLGAILLLAAALALVASELFLPAHGLLAGLAAAAAVGAVVLAYWHSPLAAILVGILVLVASPFVFFGAAKIYPHSPVGRRVLLQKPKADPGFDDEAAALESLIGSRGITLTLLRPAGTVDVGGKVIDALSESDQIEAGSSVEIIRVSGLKVFVKSV
jgi:membrane-bound ClpP family serine protease